MFSTPTSKKRSDSRKAAAPKRTARDSTDATEANSAYPLIPASSLPVSTSGFWLSRGLVPLPRSEDMLPIGQGTYAVHSITFLGIHNEKALFCIMSTNTDKPSQGVPIIFKMDRYGHTSYTWLKRDDSPGPDCPPGDLSIFLVKGTRPKPIIALMTRGSADSNGVHFPRVFRYTPGGKTIATKTPTSPPPAELERGTTGCQFADTPEGFIVLEPNMFFPKLHRTLICTTTFARLRLLGPAVDPAGKTLMQTKAGLVVVDRLPGDGVYWSHDARTAATISNRGKTITMYDTTTETELSKIETEEEWAHVAVAFLDDDVMAVVRVSCGHTIQSVIYA